MDYVVTATPSEQAAFLRSLIDEARKAGKSVYHIYSAAQRYASANAIHEQVAAEMVIKAFVQGYR